MYLVDIGNTFTKIYSTTTFLKKIKTDKNIINDIISLSKNKPVYIFSVVTILSDKFSKIKNIFIVKNNQCFNNLYLKSEYKNLIGIDRLVCIIGAQQYSNSIAVIDIGTAMTVDIVIKNRYIQGYIFPGVHLMQESLHLNTSKLPNINKENNPTTLQIENGIKLGIVGAIKKYIDNYNVRVIITGGGSEYISNRCEKEWIIDEKLMHNGMKKILGDINEKKKH